MIGLYEKAAELYHHVLVNTQLGEKALVYLKKRGITEADMQDFDLGFAPADQDLLLSFLKEQQIDQKQMQDSGLFIETADGSLKDRFFNRIMFPIKDNNGKIVAFSGRSLVKDDQHPKYLNSPETSIFNKGKVLYNFCKPALKLSKRKPLFYMKGLWM